jgi:O-antigen/teichoic acid export membrane protein
MVWFLGSYLVAVLGYLALNAIAGRWLGTSDFGYFVVVLTGTGLLAQIGLVGVHRSGLREAARIRGTDDPEAVATLRNGVRAVVLTALPLTAVASAVVTWFVTSDQDRGTRVALAAIVGTLVVLGGHQKLWANYLRGFGYVRLAGLVEGRSGGALVAGGQALLLLLGWLLFPGWGLVGALAAVAVGYAVPVVVARQVVRRHWGEAVGEPPKVGRDLKATVARDWRFVSVQVATYLNINIEVWVAAALLTAVDTSEFTAALRLTQLLVLPMTAIQVVFSPAIARMTHQPDQRERVQTLLRTGATIAATMTLVLWLPMLVAPGLVLDLVYGEGFGEGALVLVVLSVGFIVNVLTGLAGTTLSMAGREGVGAQVQWAGVVLRVALVIPAALLGGVVAVAAVASAVSATVFVTMWFRTRRVLGIRTHVTLRPDLRILRRTAG